MNHIAWVFLIGSAIAASFLVYSLLHLRQLGITITHPRVLVEGGLAIILLATGLLMLRCR
jgi:hypothetical protein